jgi:hypothetical protein
VSWKIVYFRKIGITIMVFLVIAFTLLIYHSGIMHAGFILLCSESLLSTFAHLNRRFVNSSVTSKRSGLHISKLCYCKVLKVYGPIDIKLKPPLRLNFDACYYQMCVTISRTHTLNYLAVSTTRLEISLLLSFSLWILCGLAAEN